MYFSYSLYTTWGCTLQDWLGDGTRFFQLGPELFDICCPIYQNNHDRLLFRSSLWPRKEVFIAIRQCSFPNVNSIFHPAPPCGTCEASFRSIWYHRYRVGHKHLVFLEFHHFAYLSDLDYDPTLPILSVVQRKEQETRYQNIQIGIQRVYTAWSAEHFDGILRFLDLYCIALCLIISRGNIKCCLGNIV